MPLVMASAPTPLRNELSQPRPCASMSAPSGSRPTWLAGPAPWATLAGDPSNAACADRVLARLHDDRGGTPVPRVRMGKSAACAAGRLLQCSSSAS
jgi:hypothetical protein